MARPTTRQRIVRVVLIACGILVGSSAVALATSQVIGGGGVIQGCYRISDDDQKGQLRVVTDATACRTNEATISWNVQGPRGEKGDPGQQGNPGPTGPRGADGVTGYVRVQTSGLVSSQSESAATYAFCPAATRVIGGGFETAGVDTPVPGSLAPFANAPGTLTEDPLGQFGSEFVGRDYWLTGVRNPSHVTERFTVHAICARIG